jgi:hypothetical protein
MLSNSHCRCPVFALPKVTHGVAEVLFSMIDRWARSVFSALATMTFVDGAIFPN